MTDKSELRYWDGEEHSMIDRYTAVWPDGSYVGMGYYALQPRGFCQHGSGAEYEPVCSHIGDSLYSHLGKLIGFEDLPEDCQTVVLRDLESEA